MAELELFRCEARERNDGGGAAFRIQTISERCSWTVAASLINRFREALVPDRIVNAFYQRFRPVGITIEPGKPCNSLRGHFR